MSLHACLEFNDDNTIQVSMNKPTIMESVKLSAKNLDDLSATIKKGKEILSKMKGRDNDLNTFMGGKVGK